MRPLEKTFENILVKYGHTIYLQRRVHGVAKGPYQEIAGGRYENKIEAWTAYRIEPAIDEKPMPEGYVKNYDSIYYMQVESHPSTGDLVAEKTGSYDRWDRDVYSVESAVPFYLNNKLVFFKVKCMRMKPVS